MKQLIAVSIFLIIIAILCKAAIDKYLEEYERHNKFLEGHILTLTYNEDGTPNLNHDNSGMRQSDIIASLEIAKIQVIQSVMRGVKGK